MRWLRTSWDAVWLWIDWHGRITTVVAIIVALGGAVLVNRAASVLGEVHGVYLYVISGLAFAVFLATIVIIGRKVEVGERAKRSVKVEQSKDGPESPRQTPIVEGATQLEPTLVSLMDTSFPNLNKLWGKPVLTFDDGATLQITSALYFDLFTSGAKFLGFHVPSSPRVLDACAAIAAHATELGDALGDGGLKVICKAPGENPQTLNDLRYSGKVYLYHDDALTHKQMADVEDIFKSQQLAVVLRGPDFLTPAWIAWKQKSLGLAVSAPPMSTAQISKPNLSLEWGMTRVTYDSERGVWTEHLNLGLHPSTAFLLHITNSPPGVGLNGVRAQIEWMYETGVAGPSFRPAMWLNEPCGKVDLPVAWRRTLLVGIKTNLGYGVCGWTGYDNRKINPSEQPNSHSEIVPQDGTLLVKVIDESGDVLFEARLEWQVDLYTFLPDVKRLAS